MRGLDLHRKEQFCWVAFYVAFCKESVNKKRPTEDGTLPLAGQHSSQFVQTEAPVHTIPASHLFGGATGVAPIQIHLGGYGVHRGNI